MNATVSKSGKKGGGAKTASAAESKAKPATKSTLKTVASNLVKTIKGVLKPAADEAKPAREAKEKAAKIPAKPSGKTTAAGKPKLAENVEAKPENVSATRKNASAVAGTEDKIDRIEVSKVSEVASKTPKSTPAADNDGSLLTDEQILKMSDKDYMNPAQLAFFKARLQQLERELLKNAGETTEHLRETVLVPDPADRATIEEEHALELRTRDRERKLLKKVQQAIASIDAGEYGWCEETGEPIGIARLMARPTATLSLEAQQRRELKQKLYGD